MVSKQVVKGEEGYWLRMVFKRKYFCLPSLMTVILGESSISARRR